MRGRTILPRRIADVGPWPAPTLTPQEQHFAEELKAIRGILEELLATLQSFMPPDSPATQEYADFMPPKGSE